MRTEYRIFGLLTGILVVFAVAYGVLTAADSPYGRPEWVGVVALLLSAVLCGMCGLFLWLVSRRIDPRPEDRDDAEPADGAGVVGFFSPGSYWPVGIAVAAAVAAFGIAAWQWWLVGLGVTGVLLTAGGLLFEYYVGTRREV